MPSLPNGDMKQGGTSDDDVFLGGGMGDNGSVILVGSSYGNWKDVKNKGGEDFIAVKLDPDGSILWTWQVITHGCLHCANTLKCIRESL